MKKTVGKSIISLISIVFSIFFIVILFNNIFFNRTVDIEFNVFIMIFGTLITYICIYGLRWVYKKKKLKFLEHKPKKIEILTVFLIVFIIQFLFAKLAYMFVGWDCGGVIGNAKELAKGNNVDIYFARYPNNIGILLITKYILVISKQFVDISILANDFFVMVIFNIIIIDLAAVLLFLTIKKLLNSSKAYFSLIFIIPMMILFPYILIPYTDTITMIFPIAILYIYLLIKEYENRNIKKYILLFILGVLIAGGIYIKPTVVIMPIAILIVEILNINKEKFKLMKKDMSKKFLCSILMVIIFGLGCGATYLIYNNLKNKNLDNYISNEQYESNEVPFTHFIMIGMQSYNDEITGKPLYGAYFGEDADNTTKIEGKQEKQEYNIQVIKERLQNFGFKNYLIFLYNKACWILSDGTFFFEQEGTFEEKDFFNTSPLAEKVQKFINAKSDEYTNITANILQIVWLLIIIGLIFSYKNKENKGIDISKFAVIGIILFILMFEGRSRYLINYLPIFILVGVYGLSKSFTVMGKLTKIIKDKFFKFNEPKKLINGKDS